MSDSGNEKLFEGRFLINEEIGVGGMGRVFAARQLAAGRDVALKLLLNERMASEEAIARFHREFKLLSRLSHPHIMTVYGISLDIHGKPYAVCELLKGETLSSLLAREGALSWERAVRIALQIGQSIQYAHEQGIIHRDLKPDNVMLLDTPEPDFVKVVDFGLAGILDGQQRLSQKFSWTGKAIGTPAYMSPEQALSKADKRSDIYSLGCVLFELLAGECLFAGASPAMCIVRHCTENPTARFPIISQKLPARLLSLLAWMLSKNPEARIQSMEEVTKTLESILDGPGELVGDKGHRFKSGQRWQAGVLAGFLSLLLCGIGYGVYFIKTNSQSGYFVQLPIFKFPGKLGDNVDTAKEISPNKLGIDSNNEHGWRRLLEALEKKHGYDEPELAEPCRNLVDLYSKQDRFAEAEPLLKQLLAIEKKKRASSEPLKIASILDELANCYEYQGKSAAAEPLYKSSVAMTEKAFGPDSPDVLDRLEDLAQCCYDQKKLEDAETLYMRLIASRRKQLATDPQTATKKLGANCSSLAYCYKSAGKFAETELFLRRSLALQEKAFGTDSLEVGECCFDLADCYENEGKRVQAQPLYERSLSIKQKFPAADKQELADTLAGLARCHIAQNEFAQAIPLLRQLLAIGKKAPAENNSDLAEFLHDLAYCYEQVGEHTEAIPLYERSIAIQEKTFGLTNRHLDQSLMGLARCYLKKSQFVEAEPLLERSLAIREKSTEASQPDLDDCLGALAYCYSSDHKWEQAELLYKRLVPIREKIRGENRSETADAIEGQAYCLVRNPKEKDNWALAKLLYKRALSIREKSPGAKSMNLANVIEALAYCLSNDPLSSQRNYVEAERLYRRSLVIREKAQGAEQPELVGDLGALASCYAAQSNWAAAEPLYKRLLAISEARQPANQQELVANLRFLASCYANQRKQDQAEPLYRRALAISEKTLGANH